MRTVWLMLYSSAAGWKNRRNIGFLIVLIILMISTFYYAKEQETAETGKIVLGVAKEDTSEYANLLMQYFNENEVFLKYVELIEESEQTLKNAMTAGELDAYLVIPENFAQNMIVMENLPIQAVVSMKNPTKALVMRHVMEAYETYIEAVEVNCTALYRKMREEGFSSSELNAANMEISLELIFTALGKDDLFRRREVEIKAEEVTETVSLAEHYRWTVVYFVLLFFFLPAGMRVLELRRKGLMDRLRVMNTSRASVLFAVGLPYLVMAVAVLGFFCSRYGITDRLPEAMLYLLPWLPVLLGLGLVCDTRENYLFVCSLGVILLAVLGGSLIPGEFLPDSFQKLAEVLPNHAFVSVMGGVQP